MEPPAVATEWDVDPSAVPARERVWADHDQPWQYAKYHLSLRTQARLIVRRERIITEEFEYR